MKIIKYINIMLISVLDNINKEPEDEKGGLGQKWNHAETLRQSYCQSLRHTRNGSEESVSKSNFMGRTGWVQGERGSGRIYFGTERTDLVEALRANPLGALGATRLTLGVAY